MKWKNRDMSNWGHLCFKNRLEREPVGNYCEEKYFFKHLNGFVFFLSDRLEGGVKIAVFECIIEIPEGMGNIILMVVDWDQ